MEDQPYDLLRLAEEQRRAALTYVQRDLAFPIWHIAAPVGRINDPNGLVYWRGRYHAFYQWGPYAPDAKVVYWGHAVSTDLLHWSHEPPAIAPDRWYDKDGCYSGSAVIRGAEVVCIYTGNVKNAHGGREAYQCAFTMTERETQVRSPAWSFAKWPNNPVIPKVPAGYTAHFRDPMVFSQPSESGGHYRMCLGAQRTDKTGAIVLYESDDLNAWVLDAELGFAGPGAAELTNFGYMWECPNIFEMWDEKLEATRTVVLWCPQGLAADGDRFQSRYQCGYVVGDLDGNVLRNCTEFEELDLGTEFYAPQVFAGLEDGQQILMGWAGNAEEDDLPTMPDAGWVHMLTLPRRMRLVDGRLYQMPAVEFADFGVSTEVANFARSDAHKGTEIEALAGARAWRMKFATSYRVGMTLEISSGKYQVAIDFSGGVVTVDRSRARYVGGNGHAAAVRTVTFAPQWKPGDEVAIDIVHDHSVTELYINAGRTVMTWRTILGKGQPRITLEVDRKTVPGPVYCIRAD